MPLAERDVRAEHHRGVAPGEEDRRDELQAERGLNAIARESTNIIDASYTGADGGLVPAILETAALALREYGAARVAEQAAPRVGAKVPW